MNIELVTSESQLPPKDLKWAGFQKLLSVVKEGHWIIVETKPEKFDSDRSAIYAVANRLRIKVKVEKRKGNKLSVTRLGVKGL